MTILFNRYDNPSKSIDAYEEGQNWVNLNCLEEVVEKAVQTMATQNNQFEGKKRFAVLFENYGEEDIHQMLNEKMTVSEAIIFVIKNCREDYATIKDADSDFTYCTISYFPQRSGDEVYTVYFDGVEEGIEVEETKVA